LILFFDLAFLQSLIFNKGIVGNLFVNTLEKFIGVFGVILLIIVIGIWGSFMIFEEEVIKFFQTFKLKKLNFKNKTFKEVSNIKKENKSEDIKKILN